MSDAKRTSALPFRSASPEEQERFLRARETILKKAPRAGYAGVGTLAEKPMHAILKHYLSEDEDDHEVGVLDTDYVSDVRLGNTIYEVQSGSVFPMKEKIAHYLNKTDCRVVVIHPMLWGGSLIRLDPNSGEVLSKRKSSVREQPLFFLSDLYSLRTHLSSDRLSFCLLFVEADDYRLPHAGRGKREKIVRIPTSLLGRLELCRAADFASLLPSSLPDSFSAKEFALAAHLRGRAVYSILHVLSSAGALQETKDEKGHFVFTRK